MQEVILTKIILYAPVGILIMLLILVPILTATLRRIKKINEKMDNTLEKAEAYFNYILEEEETETVPVLQKEDKPKKKAADKAEDAELLQDVLLEYFS